MGVAHLAYTLANQIYQLQGKDLDITRSDVKCAEVAGALPHFTWSFQRLLTAVWTACHCSVMQYLVPRA